VAPSGDTNRGEGRGWCELLSHRCELLSHRCELAPHRRELLSSPPLLLPLLCCLVWEVGEQDCSRTSCTCIDFCI